MQICITQIDGIRHFSRFKNIPERDRLEIELTIEDGRQKVFNFDLTDILFEQFEKYPEILHKKRIVPKDDLLEKRPARKRKPVEATAKITVSPEKVVEAAPKKKPAAKKRTPKAVEKVVETKAANKPKFKPFITADSAKKPQTRKSTAVPKQTGKPVQVMSKVGVKPNASSPKNRGVRKKLGNSTK